MSSEDIESVVAAVFEEGNTSVTDVPVRRPNIPALVDGGEYEYSWLLSSYDGSDGVESRLRREEGPIDFCEETAFEAIKAGVDPREVEAAFEAADVARREIAGRPAEVAATDDQEDWETNTPIGPRAPTLKNLSLDFRAAWERIRRLAPIVRDVKYLNNEERRIAARVFSFARHLSISDTVYPRVPDLPNLQKMAHNAGILGRLRMASRSDRAPTAAAHPPPERKRRDAPGPSSERRSLEEEVPPLARDKKRKLVDK
ncbi:hypothetical protein OROMI_021035 [Orobanche minor]